MMPHPIAEAQVNLRSSDVAHGCCEAQYVGQRAVVEVGQVVDRLSRWQGAYGGHSFAVGWIRRPPALVALADHDSPASPSDHLHIAHQLVGWKLQRELNLQVTGRDTTSLKG
jgi:hypothetical protein